MASYVQLAKFRRSFESCVIGIIECKFLQAENNVSYIWSYFPYLPSWPLQFPSKCLHNVTSTECTDVRKSRYTSTWPIWQGMYRKPSNVFIPSKTSPQFVNPNLASAAISNSTSYVSTLLKMTLYNHFQQHA